VEDESAYSARTSLDSSVSPIYTDFKTETPMIRNDSPFSPWSAGDDFFSQAQGIDLAALYMRQQQYQPISGTSLMSRQIGTDSDVLKAMQLSDGLNFADGTIRPNMLDCRNSYDMDQMDNILYTADYELSMGIA